MNFILMLVMAQLMGMQINNPSPDKVIIVKTDREPRSEHHWILDSSPYTRLDPFEITIRSNQDIHSMAVVYDVVDMDGVTHNLPLYYDGPYDGHFAVVRKGSSTTFWPGGRMPKMTDHPNPLMPFINEDVMKMLETSKFITVSVPFIEFADGTIIQSDGWDKKVSLIRQTRGIGKGRLK